MAMIDERIATLPGGGILYDASLARKPQAEWFTRAYWARHGQLREVTGGRGSVCFLRTDQGSWVMRHYRRGGLIAKLSADRYGWCGEDRTRSFAEWRLLAHLRGLQLPVPKPVAAFYVKRVLTYQADLITEELPPSQTLATVMIQGLAMRRWEQVGATVAKFHAHGVHHADLNAHNILLGDGDAVYVLDFDRGRIRPRGGWEQAVLARLKRSLIKVGGERGVFGAQQWGWLMRGYEGVSD